MRLLEAGQLGGTMQTLLPALRQLGLLSGAFFVFGFAPRITSVLILLALLASHVVHRIRPVPRIRRALWIAFIVATVFPVDVQVRGFGSPRLVPLVMGLPGPELREKAARGEVILGGCMISGTEPKWILIIG